MKKHFSVLAIATLCLIGMMAASPLFAQEEAWSLVGTWVNPAYDGSNSYPAKVVYSDNTESIYVNVDGTLPEAVGTYMIEKDWTESGAHWFKVKATYTPTAIYYELDKLTEGGNKYESVFSQGNYPAQFDTTSSAYAHVVRSRQE